MENVVDLFTARRQAVHPIHGSPLARERVAAREEMLVQHLRRGRLPLVRLELLNFGTTDGFVPTSDWGRIQSEWAKALLARV